MKKLILLLALLPNMAFCTTAFNIWRVSVDTSTLGSTIDLYTVGSHPPTFTDTGRVYVTLSTASYSVQVFKINMNAYMLIPLEVDGTRKITITLPSDQIFVGKSRIKDNYDSDVIPIFLRSFVPDLTMKAFGAQSGFSGFSTYFKVKYTYIPKITDTIEIFNEGVLVKKIPLKDIEGDSTIYFNVSGDPGFIEITSNFSISTDMNSFSWGNYTINTPIVINPPTSIVEPFDYSNKKEVVYYDILGRIVSPKEGDIIRYTNFGAIVY